MNKIVLIVIMVGMISCAEKKTAKRNDSNQEISKEGQLTQIEFDSDMHDFGHVKSGEILVYSFVFTNSGENDLVIDKAEADCGCIQTNLPKDPVPPGKDGLIEIEFNSAGMIGKQLKTIEILSNSKEPKHLIIFAEVENEQIEFKN